MRALVYYHPDTRKEEEKIVETYCKEHDLDLVGSYMDSDADIATGPIEERRALGEMLNHLRGHLADCALTVVDTNDPNSVEVRFCSYTQCFGQANSGACQKGFIKYPEQCVFR